MMIVFTSFWVHLFSSHFDTLDDNDDNIDGHLEFVEIPLIQHKKAGKRPTKYETE